jgi:hypothetical protein
MYHSLELGGQSAAYVKVQAVMAIWAGGAANEPSKFLALGHHLSPFPIPHSHSPGLHGALEASCAAQLTRCLELYGDVPSEPGRTTTTTTTDLPLPRHLPLTFHLLSTLMKGGAFF